MSKLSDKKSISRTILKNTAMLYGMNIAKLVLPLITLPYLTRVLSKDCYGTVSYVKAVMQYMQIIVDFGFMLSATKDIVKVRENKRDLSNVVGDTLQAKLVLVLAAFVLLALMVVVIPILQENILYTFLSFTVVALTCFLMDFLFRGLEEMHVITFRYILMRLIAVVLTFIFVKSDSDMLLIPAFDIIASFAAIALVFREMKKRGISIVFSGVKKAMLKLKESAVYFLSNMATTTFSALNTLIIGAFLDTGKVAEWSVCMQMVTAAMSLYTPITDGIYPHMVKTRDWGIIRKTVKIFMPVVFFGCVFTFFVAEHALLLVGGEKYMSAYGLLRAFIPLMFVAFPAILFGWPALGAIGKEKETTITTLLAAGLQVSGILLLLATGQLTVINLALLRGGTDACMFLMRYGFCMKFKGEFAA